MFNVLRDDVLIGQVLYEDDDTIVLKVPKDLAKEIHLKGGEEFYTIVFLHAVGRRMVSWLPWKRARND